ncbi:nucleotide exchange factor GrpE [Thioalkalivibrio sp. XN8]|uniref:nucleotide exchange factor GrpE n=1 Tax=Thioalkalivibrio sp. XN8 TaxID=2712863 RepID=UPI0013ECEA8B|nr:nucleotide exchange factor GrpE [Thioalkalivibrio sp. XN8]NGP54543.1 nucleotide exchange factor GrpE [Thioalkalivibrio sp. XN8]
MSDHDKDLQAEEITGGGRGAGESAAAGDHAARADQAEQAAVDLREQLLRAAAELENVRRRAARDVESAHRYGIERFARELLAVVDSLEMGRDAARAAGEGGAVAEGMDATLRLLLQVLEKFGVTAVEAAGRPFDPEVHEAIMTQPSAEAAPDTVLAVVQSGYRIHDRLLRPARVIVARPPEA